MKKNLFIGIAALFLVTGAAHAAETTKLPDAILGAWCGSRGWQFPDDDTAHLWRTDDVHDCANRGGIDIHPNSYDYVRFEVKTSCKINSIKFVRRGDPKKDRIRPKVYDPKTEKYPKQRFLDNPLAFSGRLI